MTPIQDYKARSINPTRYERYLGLIAISVAVLTIVFVLILPFFIGVTING